MKLWSIKTRVVVGFSIVFAIFALMSGYVYLRLLDISAKAHVIRDAALPGVFLASQIDSINKANYMLTQRHLLEDSAEKKAAIEKQMKVNSDRLTEIYNTYDGMIDSPAERAIYDEISKWRKQYGDIRKNILSASNSKNTEEATKLLLEALEPVYQSYAASIQRAVSFNREEGNKAGEDILSTSKATGRGIIIAFVLAMLLGGGAAVLIVSNTSKIVSSVANNIDQGADQVAEASSQVSKSSQQVAQGSSEQAASLEETSASLEEISGMTKRTAEQAGQAKELARQTSQAANVGLEDMRRMTQAMDEIKASSDNIAKIVKTIDEIAFQTNILALNAAVEAARAGDAGLGFAVVADEVRSLAQRCAQSARETAAMIEDSVRKSHNGVEISSKVASGLEQIAAKAGQVDGIIAEIAAASVEQTEGIAQVNTAVNHMDAATQSNAAGSEESASAAQQLNAQAFMLKKQIQDLLLLAGKAAEARAEKATQPSVAVAAKLPPPKHAPAKEPQRKLAKAKSSSSGGDFFSS